MSTLQQRFDAKYERVAGIECWIWMAATHQFGYGHIYDGKKVNVAHRVSYQLHIGEIPDGKQVLHRCDNPACVSTIKTMRLSWAECHKKYDISKSQYYRIKHGTSWRTA